jgi:hypothetical protein
MDATFYDHGSIWLVVPHSEAAQQWINDNVDPEAQWYCGALVVEPRYVEPLAKGMASDGLEVSL